MITISEKKELGTGAGQVYERMAFFLFCSGRGDTLGMYIGIYIPLLMQKESVSRNGGYGASNGWLLSFFP